MKTLLLNSTLLILISMTACRGAGAFDEEQKSPLRKGKRPLDTADELGFLLSHAGEGADGIGVLQRQMSVPNGGYDFSELLRGIPIGASGLGDGFPVQQSKKSCIGLGPASSTGAAEDKSTDTLPFPHHEKRPTLEKEIDPKADVISRSCRKKNVEFSQEKITIPLSLIHI